MYTQSKLKFVKPPQAESSKFFLSFELNESQDMGEIASSDRHAIQNDFPRIQ